MQGRKKIVVSRQARVEVTFTDSSRTRALTVSIQDGEETIELVLPTLVAGLLGDDLIHRGRELESRIRAAQKAATA